MPANSPEFLASIDAAAPAMLERLITWANTNSGSDNTEGLLTMGALIESAIAELGVPVDRIPIAPDGRFALRAVRRGRTGRSVLLNGHFDTVYGPAHPFQQCHPPTDDDRLRGPGVADMKGGIVILIEALRAFENSPAAPDIGWEVLLTPDEETGSVLSAPLLRESARHHDIGIVFEAALPDGSIVASRKGVGVVRVEAHGRAAHAGRDFAHGRNAIAALAEFVVAADHLNGQIPDIVVNAGAISGGGTLNIVPDHATAAFNLRADRADDGEETLRRLRAAATEIGRRREVTLTLEGGFSRLPMELTEAKRPWIDAWCACAARLGLRIGHGHTGGGSDANILTAAGLPCIDGAGVEGGELHSEREWMRPSSLARRARIAALFLHEFARGRIPAA